MLLLNFVLKLFPRVITVGELGKEVESGFGLQSVNRSAKFLPISKIIDPGNILRKTVRDET